MEPEVLYLDNHLLVVNKPPGMLTQPDKTGEESLQSFCKEYLKKRFQKPGKVFLESIHRLDKPVGGIVLFARTSKALSRLQQQMREKQIRKTYLAWVEGVFSEKKGILEHFLIHGEHKALVVTSNHPEGKRSLLHYEILEEKEGLSLVRIELETGRYHQIRAQFSAIGTPIWGDLKYGGNFPYGRKGIALYHTEIQFYHPVQSELLNFSIAFPFMRDRTSERVTRPGRPGYLLFNATYFKSLKSSLF